jgi:peptide/nickel transport system permease protein
MTVLGRESVSPTSVSQIWRGHPLLWYVVRRIGAGIALMFAVSILVFLGTQILPGDAAAAILGRSATPEALKVLRHQLGLDRPLLTQYTSWIGGVLHGNLGTSMTAQEPVTTFIRARVTNTLMLALLTMLVCIPVSLLLGVLAAMYRDKWVDRLISYGTLALIALPEFVIGPILILGLSIYVPLFPPVSLVPPGTDPLSTPSLMVLPILTLLFALVAYSVRMVRAGVCDVLASEYVASAWLNGAPRGRVMMRHVLPNAIAPSIQVFALTAQWLVGGIVVVETVFQYPGLGQGLVQAVAARDIPVVQAIALLIAAVYISINIIADLLVILLVPRVRTSIEHG